MSPVHQTPDTGSSIRSLIEQFEKASTSSTAADARGKAGPRLSPSGQAAVSEKPTSLRLSENSTAPRGSGALPLQSPNVDALLHSFVGRGIDRFKAEGAAPTIAAALDDKKHVMLLTGFSVAPDLPETDGMGTALLGKALKEAGKLVTFVTDGTNRPILQSAMKEIDPEMAAYARFVAFDPPHGAPAEAAADRLLDRLQPDAVVAVELPGRSQDTKHDGTHVYRNMRGVDISPFNGPVDQVLVEANKRPGIFTAGVGDGGNEAGVIGPNIPQALDGSNMANTVPADVTLTAWNSNLGAAAIGAAVLQRNGKLDKMPPPDAYVRAIEATMAAGAVDGVTRGRVPNEKMGDNHSGVDGFHLETHAGDLRKLTAAIARDIPAGVVQAEKDNPYIVVGTDSSDGGLIGGKNLLGFLQHRYHAPAVVVSMLDHANAPYGDHTRENLVVHAGRMEQSALLVGDLTATVCNTQATTLPESLHIPPNAPGDAGAARREQRTVNLVDVTARAIVDSGGPHPVLLSTQGTKDSGAYPAKIKAYSEGRVDPGMVACPEWAPLVNERKHESDRPEDKAYVEQSVRKIVGSLKEMHDAGELTSLYLCCTHYPALLPHIQRELKAQGMADVQVIDPIESLAEAVMHRLDDIGGEIDRTKRTVSNDPIVLTTAHDPKKVQVAAQHILRNRNPGADPPKVSVLSLPSFGHDIDLSLLQPTLFPQSKSAVRIEEITDDEPDDHAPLPLAGLAQPSTAASSATTQRLQ